MIAAKKSAWFEYGFRYYNRYLLKKTFAQIAMDQLDLCEGSVLLCCNHVAWWDPLVLFFLNEQRWHKDAYGFMGHEGLTAYPFFRKLGAFSLDDRDARDVLRGFHYALSILQKKDALLIWFAQGEEKHPEARPLGFSPGLAKLYTLAKRQNIPFSLKFLSLRYDFLERKKPEILISTKNPYANNDPLAFEKIATEQLTTLTKTIASWTTNERRITPGFTPLLRRDGQEV